VEDLLAISFLLGLFKENVFTQKSVFAIYLEAGVEKDVI